MGLIFDDRGNRMSPSYTLRRGNRYRYYTCQPSLRRRDKQAGSRPCVSADDVEKLVVETLGRALTRAELSTDVAAGIWSAQTRTLVRDTVERIVLRGKEIDIVLKNRAGEPTSTADEESESAGVATVLKASLPAPRPRARKQILLPGGSRSPPRHVDRALILALARARAWMRALRAGNDTDTAEIAQRSGLSDPHVRRRLRFACLAPDIVEAIVEGRQPRTLTVRRLLQGIPLAWSDQRAAFGFGG
jgi:site-specific DNA recombinase